MKIKLLIAITIIFFVSLFITIRANASEGIAELNSVDGSKARCYAMSTLTNRSTSYQLQIQCQNLVYPIEPEGIFYILWTNPIAKDSKPAVLGDLEFGKKTFSTQASFSGLLITKEQAQYPQQPSNEKVMQGNIKSISFLDTEPSPTPKPTARPTQTKSQISLSAKQTPSVSQMIKPTPQPQNSGVFSSAIKIIMIIFAIIALIIIIAFIIYLVNKIRKSLTGR